MPRKRASIKTIGQKALDWYAVALDSDRAAQARIDLFNEIAAFQSRKAAGEEKNGDV